MILMCVDTSGPSAGLALVRDGELIYEATLVNSLTHSVNLMPMAEEALRSSGLEMKDIGLFAAVAGPGSFTGVRIGVAAVQGMGCKQAIILGGEGKEQDFKPLEQALAKHSCGVALIGRDAGLIAEAIEGCGVPVQRCANLPEAVRWCAAQAKSGEAVLLSPACASYDMFRNYFERAEVFVGVVRQLEMEASDAARV